MALDGANANLGPESADWVQKVEQRLEQLANENAILKSQLQAVTR